MMAFPTPPLARELLEGEARFITYACACKINACQWYPHIQGLQDMLDQLSQESGWSSMGLRGDMSPKGGFHSSQEFPNFGTDIFWEGADAHRRVKAQKIKA